MEKLKSSKKFQVLSYEVKCPYCGEFVECFNNGNGGKETCNFCGKDFEALESD